MPTSKIYEPDIVSIFVKEKIDKFKNLEAINSFFKYYCGIIDFFSTKEELTSFLSFVEENESTNRYNGWRGKNKQIEEDKGDYQTNERLASECVDYIVSQCPSSVFELLIEPTCGKGNFILAALAQITSLKKIIGIEISLAYVWETKLRILQFFIKHPHANKPEIQIINENVFKYDFNFLSKTTTEYITLIIGNPPWVTNSRMGAISSENLPLKSNLKKHKGIEAITGKSNFDIGEAILNNLLKNFSGHDGCLGFLIKSSVVKNRIYEQKSGPFRIGELKSLVINSKQEFGVSVEASLFFAKLNIAPEFVCSELDFYNSSKITTFGWENGYYAHSIEKYKLYNEIEGKSPFEWRQGIKHDCAKIMELEKQGEYFINGLGEHFLIESELVYRLLKSSDLKNKEASTPRKWTIITQMKIGGDTAYIEKEYPLAYAYLSANKQYFIKRKSSIYNNKPDFSIFGVGPYSFAQYKVCISGLYKTTHFSLATSQEKPVMLDDTCYFIGFENPSYARIAHYLLNREEVQLFIKSIVFPSSKRPITKDILMRVACDKIYNSINFNDIKQHIKGVGLTEWEGFGNMFVRPDNKTIS